MPTRDLLPGVTTDSCPPRIVCDAKEAIRKARRRALLRDIGELTILLGVDWLFFRWPESRIPFLTRDHSLVLLQTVNAIAVADLWISRALPKWAAARISSTWCRSEREKFQTQARPAPRSRVS